MQAIANTNAMADMVEPFNLDQGTKYPHIYENPEQTFYQKVQDAVEHHPYTTRNPITMIGTEAGICWGADTTNEEKNYKRGIDCLENEHGRTFEFPDVYAVLDGYSARVIREWYTHIGGAPTRLQASTRYIDYEHGFAYLYSLY